MAAISVIVPVYNVESYLPQCMDSIRRQTFSDIEIVCVVDGSTDRSEAILRLYEKVEPRLRIVVKKNGGLSSARNAGIEASTSPLLMFVDSDDMLEPRACETVCAAFQAYDADLVTFGANCYPAFESTPWYDKVLSPRNVHYSEFDAAIVFDEASRPFAWRTAAKAKFFERTGLRFDETVRFGEDQIFQFEAYPQANGVTFISDKLYDYRLARKDSLMATTLANMGTKLREHILISHKICAAWEHLDLMAQYGERLLDFMAEFLLYDYMVAPRETRDELLSPLLKFLTDWFEPDQALKINMGEPAQLLLKHLIAGGFPPEKTEELRQAYLDSLGYVEGTPARPKWQDGLRTVLPMTALANEERLNEERDLVDADRMRWYAEDAAACAKALALLQAELLAASLS